MTIHSKTRVVVGISGGVDSTIAAWLLKEQGFEVIGLFMKNWEEDDDPTYCSAAEDLAIATESCETIDIPLQTVNFSYEYWERVFSIFLEEYRKGHTPNPDVLCNREIKFREFLEFATKLGADLIATGHYARTRKRGSLTQLLKGVDPEKDQSYFLHQVPQAALARTLFPVGDLEKNEVRSQARTLRLPNSDRKDSTGICFIGERRFKDFLARYLPPNPGEIRTLDGRMIGEHDGLWFYTLGQRHGLDIGGPGEAWYVAKKDMSRNILRVVQGHSDPVLMRRTIRGFEPHWIAGHIPDSLPIKCAAKIRYRQIDQPCRLSCQNINSIDVQFDHDQRAVTPGQSVVFYDGEVVLGGATISARDNANGARN
jgi:tRNA-specific 2-thiouridylase